MTPANDPRDHDGQRLRQAMHRLGRDPALRHELLAEESHFLFFRPIGHQSQFLGSGAGVYFKQTRQILLVNGT